ncbi:MAG: PSD1 domain-containing protein [Pirellulales bacterium]|nr:PSD1 domain-containing protein [Pirellulales bacterium]
MVLSSARYGQLKFPAALGVGLLTIAFCQAPAAAAIDFNRDIRPVLSENCYFCHGPDKNHREANLRLDDRKVALEMGAVVPGKPNSSSLIARIFSSDPDEQMPPPDSRKRLNDEQKRLLRQWVEEGAIYKRHWAYEPPVRPELQKIQGSELRIQNEIDLLVAARLTKEGLVMSPQADRRTLLRRLYFDLIGLPPTPEQVDAFAMNSSSDAYEQVVEHLLASPHYGERMAIGWLDVVRFADTIGYHSDNPRNVWPYRDYVIRSLNENKRFDQFTIEQLAGDLLEGSTQEQQVASCFNRLLLSTEEGGAQAKDYEARMLTDRVRAMGTVWLGQTLGCCQCHDHKFDPTTTKDFYSMGAFFADIDEPIIGHREPGMIVPSAEQSAKLANLKVAATELRKQFDATATKFESDRLAWETAVLAEVSDEDRWKVLQPKALSSSDGVRLIASGDGIIRAESMGSQKVATYVIECRLPLKKITGLRLDVLPGDDMPKQGSGLGPGGSFVLSEFELDDSDGRRLALSRASATTESDGNPAATTIDGVSDDKKGWSVEAAGAAQSICFELQQPLAGDGETALIIHMQQNDGETRLLRRFRLSATDSDKPIHSLQASIPPPEILQLIRIEPGKRKREEQSKITLYFQSRSPELVALQAKTVAAEKVAADFEAGLPHCLVSKSLATPRIVRILPRGNWMDESGPTVSPAVPQFLPQPQVEGQRWLTRLDLAHWVVSRDNPLTARVFVNRLWKQFFGIGISKTLDDIGSQGEWPVHPELLDWLACEFVDSGWDVKHLVRKIVTSQTYRQASSATAELQARDPDNRLLARQSRFRLDAELIRDNTLTISGLLVPTIGGPSVKPYQPDGYWENLNFPVRSYDVTIGPDQYRRGLYTWWQRSYVHPSMLAFDAPTREECAADRSRSNIPQQALVLLNDPTYVEAARAFAGRILQEGGNDVEGRIRWAWRQALGRLPREVEAKTVSVILEKRRAQRAAAPDQAMELLKVGQSSIPEKLDPVELADWTSVARILLNLHESITRN